MPILLRRPVRDAQPASAGEERHDKERPVSRGLVRLMRRPAHPGWVLELFDVQLHAALLERVRPRVAGISEIQMSEIIPSVRTGADQRSGPSASR